MSLGPYICLAKLWGTENMPDVETGTRVDTRFKPGNTAAKGRGRRTMLERAAAREAERKAIADELMCELGRPPTMAERMLIEFATAQLIESRKLRSLGKSSEMPDRLLIRSLSKLGLNREPEQSPFDDLALSPLLWSANASHGPAGDLNVCTGTNPPASPEKAKKPAHLGW